MAHAHTHTHTHTHTDPHAHRYTEQRDEYLALVAEEKALISEFKAAEREAEKMRETREKENKDPALFKSLYVQLQDKKQVWVWVWVWVWVGVGGCVISI